LLKNIAATRKLLRSLLRWYTPAREIIIYCKDDFETFYPITTKEEIILDYTDTKTAFIKLINELKEFSIKLDTLSDKFKTQNLSKIMIWGNNYKV